MSGNVILTQNCPHCGRFTDRASGITNESAVPKPGDYTICVGCKKPLRFDKELRLRKCTNEEVKEIIDILTYHYGK